MIGVKETPFIRLLAPSYVDGIDTPDPNRVTSPKDISKTGNDNKGGHDSGRQTVVNNDYSVIFWQIMTHEFMLTKKPQVDFYTFLTVKITKHLNFTSTQPIRAKQASIVVQLKAMNSMNF